ncbi:MAG: efflux RND transporter periplasmic adaptor subunit [Gammaproteobacteria bacterium]
MNKEQIAAVILVLLAGVGLTRLVLHNAKPAVNGGGEAAAAEAVKGPHGGRLLSEGDFATEVTIFERGVPPEFRAFLYDKNKPIDPAEVKLTIELHRFGGRVDKIGFSTREDYLLGDQEIVEPHSFDVKVIAERRGKTHRWEYDSYEGRTTLTPEAVKNSGIVIETAGPAKIKTSIKVHGRVLPNEDRMAHVIPRYPGIVKKIRKRLGDAVAKDEVVAVVESNESLQSYDVESSIAGTVLKKTITQGEFVKEGEAIYTVADLGTVWVDLNVHRKDFDKLKIGQAVTIFAGEGTANASGTVSYISPFGAEDTQTMLARVELPNPKGGWRPGLFVTGEIIVEEATVPLAVKASAVQTFRDWEVVFMQDGNVFEIAILEVGRRDAEWAEVVSGLSLGQTYAADNSFVIKADIGKSGATHDH